MCSIKFKTSKQYLDVVPNIDYISFRLCFGIPSPPKTLKGHDRSTDTTNSTEVLIQLIISEPAGGGRLATCSDAIWSVYGLRCKIAGRRESSICRKATWGTVAVKSIWRVSDLYATSASGVQLVGKLMCWTTSEVSSREIKCEMELTPRRTREREATCSVPWIPIDTEKVRPAVVCAFCTLGLKASDDE